MFRFDPRNVDQIPFQLAVDLKLFPRTSIQIASRLISSISRGGGGGKLVQRYSLRNVRIYLKKINTVSTVECQLPSKIYHRDMNRAANSYNLRPSPSTISTYI